MDLRYGEIRLTLTPAVTAKLLSYIRVVHGLGWVGSGHTKWTHGQLWATLPSCGPNIKFATQLALSLSRSMSVKSPLKLLLHGLRLHSQLKGKRKGKGKGKCIAVCINTYTATGNHLPYGITQCYLLPGRGDFPAFTPAEAGTRFSHPEGMQGWVDLGTPGANSLLKTVTRQRRDCDSNPCSSEPESSTLTTRPLNEQLYSCINEW